MTDDFVIARNPDRDSRLPYLVRLPLSPSPVVFKTRGTWPRTAALYCHAGADWPDDLEIVERVAVRLCARRGAAVDLVLNRGRESRSQFVFTMARGRQVIFWQTARVAKLSRPGVAVPTARAPHVPVLRILIDDQEKYPYRFAREAIEVERRRLAAGDYAVESGGRVLATVERKTAGDLSSSLLSGRMGLLMAELAAIPRAAVVVENRYSALLKLGHVRGGVVANALAEAHARWPGVPIVFCETRPLAEDWTYRFLGAALVELTQQAATDELLIDLPEPGPLSPPPPSHATMREWAVTRGFEVPPRGRLRREIVAAFEEEHGL